MDGEASLKSSTVSTTVQPTQSSFQERLKHILQGSQEWWDYAIFWQLSTNYNDHRLHLSFGDSYFQGPKYFVSQTNAIDICSELAKAAVVRSFAIGEDFIGGTFSQGSGSCVWLAGDDALIKNASWRAKEVYSNGIKTLVSVATSLGVVEFGSQDLLKEDRVLVPLTMSLFCSGSNLTINSSYLQHDPPLLPLQDSSPFDLESPSTSTRDSMPQNKVPKTEATTTDHVNPKYIDKERKRREKLNHRFYALRSVVPYVSKMDKASLLADAVTYIGELKSKMETLTKKAESLKLIGGEIDAPMTRALTTTKSIVQGTEVKVKIVGSQAVIGVTSPDVNHPTARLMDAMKYLDITVHHASACNIGDMVIQDVVGYIREGFSIDEETLKETILERFLY